MPRNSIQIIVKSTALALAFVTGVACGDLDAALIKEECFSDSDCGSLGCVVPNPNGLNLTAIGWCLDDQSCVVGEQPFCTCTIDPGTSMPACYIDTSDYSRMVQATVPCWDQVDMNTCLCIPAGVTCQYDS